jgi:flagellar motor switch protein FliM
MVECLLGGSDPEELDVAARPLSGIELDMSLVVFEQLNDTLRDVASKDPTAKASAGKPHHRSRRQKTTRSPISMQQPSHSICSSGR